MRLSHRTTAALQLIIAMSPDELMRVDEVADAAGYSISYGEQLLKPLREAGLLVTTRGPGGGYKLARPRDQITVLEVIDAIEGAGGGVRGHVNLALLYAHLRTALKELTLAKLAGDANVT